MTPQDINIEVQSVPLPGVEAADVSLNIQSDEKTQAGPDRSSPEAYLHSVRRNLSKFFPGIKIQLGGEQVNRLPKPYIALRMERTEPSEILDHTDYYFSITLFWEGSGAPIVQQELFSWAHRRFAYSGNLVGETGEYNSNRGSIDFFISWSVPILNNYDFAPLIVDNHTIREINISVEHQW